MGVPKTKGAPKKSAPTDKPKVPPAYGRVETIAALLDISRASVWRLAARGVIPKPRRLAGKISAWCVADVLRAVGKRPVVDVVDTGLQDTGEKKRSAV